MQEMLKQAVLALEAGWHELISIHQGSLRYPGLNCRDSWEKCDCDVAKICQQMNKSILNMQSELDE